MMTIIIGKEEKNGIKNYCWTHTQRLQPYDISENESSFWVDVYGCSVKIMKTSKEGLLLSKWINNRGKKEIVDMRIKQWVLKKISVKYLDNYIFDKCKENYEQGKEDIQNKIRNILGL
jgi:hypothetical protein